MSWRVLTDLDVDRQEAAEVMEKYGFLTVLQPNTVTRMEDRGGLLCHRDQELCWICIGPKEIPEGILEEPLINAVQKSPQAKLC